MEKFPPLPGGALESANKEISKGWVKKEIKIQNPKKKTQY
jgi:hypothetical protein